MTNNEKLWFELMKNYGLKEIEGAVDNPIIVGWFAELGYPHIKDDETAWCSLALNIAAKRAGLPYSGKLDARSWMKIGKEASEPKLADIVVFWRGQKTGWQGHVGLFAGYTEDKSGIFVLGGNQGNMLGIRKYPVNTAAFGLLGFRTL